MNINPQKYLARYLPPNTIFWEVPIDSAYVTKKEGEETLFCLYSPKPLDLASLATFLHEVGHIKLGHFTNPVYYLKDREKEAWEYSVESLRKEFPTLDWKEWRVVFRRIYKCLRTYGVHRHSIQVFLEDLVDDISKP